MQDEIARIEFHNVIRDCRKQADYLLDIYREVIFAIDKEDWETKAPEKAMSNAKITGVITKPEYIQLSESWQETVREAKKGIVTSTLPWVLEEKIFNISFNCALKAVDKLAL